MAQFQTSTSPTDALAVLRTQVQQFELSTSCDDKLTKMVEPDCQRPLCVLLGDWRGRWTSEFHWTILLRSNI